MFSILLHLQSLSWSIPVVFVLGTSPTYWFIWFVWKTLSLPFPKRVFNYGDTFLYSLYQRVILFFFDPYPGLKIHLYGDFDAFSRKENVLYISNHQSVVDWVITDMMAVRCGMLGDIRYVFKNGLRFFPLYGFYFRQHGGVYVKRSRKFNKDKYNKHLSYLHGLPFWLVVFPEGTRYNTELPSVIEKSKIFASDRGLTVLDEVLTPRYKALFHSFIGLYDDIDAIYNLTIGYSNTQSVDGHRLSSPSLPDAVDGAHPELHVHLHRIPKIEIPVDESEFSSWLHQLFAMKDRKMKEFYRSKNLEITENANESESTDNLVNDSSTSSNALCVNRFDGRSVLAPSIFMHTFTALLFWASLNYLMIRSSVGRKIYLFSSTVGTLGTFLWMTLTDR